MKNQNGQHRTKIAVLIMAVAVCLLASVTARAGTNRSIVGLWDVYYSAGGEVYFHTYQQWHRDGLEFEVNSIAPGAMCQGVYSESADGSVRDFHVVFTYDADGKNNGHIEEEVNLVVNSDGDQYHGVANQKVFDLKGNLVGQGSLRVRATRISLH